MARQQQVNIRKKKNVSKKTTRRTPTVSNILVTEIFVTYLSNFWRSPDLFSINYEIKRDLS